eukprot:COSAG05_NODE_548_length_8749_cov_33.055838_15_plen_257_part_00
MDLTTISHRTPQLLRQGQREAAARCLWGDDANNRDDTSGVLGRFRADLGMPPVLYISWMPLAYRSAMRADYTELRTPPPPHTHTPGTNASSSTPDPASIDAASRAVAAGVAQYCAQLDSPRPAAATDVGVITDLLVLARESRELCEVHEQVSLSIMDATSSRCMWRRSGIYLPSTPLAADGAAGEAAPERRATAGGSERAGGSGGGAGGARGRELRGGQGRAAVCAAEVAVSRRRRRPGIPASIHPFFLSFFCYFS